MGLVRQAGASAPDSVLTDWAGNDPCGWTKVMCDTWITTSCVRELNLTNLKLQGTIGAELAALTDLTVLDLSANSLQGALPAELARLGHLKHLNVKSNLLTGPIPADLEQSTKLEELI
eukprot:gene28430-35236_t